VRESADTALANQHSANDCGGAEPDRKSRRRHRMALSLYRHPLADGDGKTANCKTKYDASDAGAHPSEKGTLIGEMITDKVSLVAGWRLRNLV